RRRVALAIGDHGLGGAPTENGPRVLVVDRAAVGRVGCALGVIMAKMGKARAGLTCAEAKLAGLVDYRAAGRGAVAIFREAADVACGAVRGTIPFQDDLARAGAAGGAARAASAMRNVRAPAAPRRRGLASRALAALHLPGRDGRPEASPARVDCSAAP